MTLLLIASPVLYAVQDWQGELANAHHLMEQGKTKEAMAAYRTHADKGNPLAQFALGWQMKLHAEAGPSEQQPKLRQQACYWFAKASEQHIPVAMQETGHCYRNQMLDSDAPLNDALAIYVAAGQNGLGAAFCDAMTVQAQLKHAYDDMLSHCEAVAAQGAIYAQRQLITLFSASPKTASQALYWLSFAAQKHGPEAYRYGLTLAQSEPPAPEQALYWLEHSASLGYLPAYLETAARYLQKITGNTATDQASQWLAKAYVWTKAWQQRVPESVEQPDWINEVQSTTPEAWHGELNNKVAEHVAKFAVLPES